jgi:hypothetical protein
MPSLVVKKPLVAVRAGAVCCTSRRASPATRNAPMVSDSYVLAWDLDFVHFGLETFGASGP